MIFQTLTSYKFMPQALGFEVKKKTHPLSRMGFWLGSERLGNYFKVETDCLDSKDNGKVFVDTSLDDIVFFDIFGD